MSSGRISKTKVGQFWACSVLDASGLNTQAYTGPWCDIRRQMALFRFSEVHDDHISMAKELLSWMCFVSL
jgi:hypothetical protein